MNSDQHHALSTDDQSLPVLRLVLPGHLGKDDILDGLVQAIMQVRSDLAERACLFQHRVYACAARGDTLGQAFCRGQVLGGEHAGTAIDEQIIGRFDLWDQYPDAIPSAGRSAHLTESPSPAGHAHRGSGLPPGLGRLEAAVMDLAWEAAGTWLAARAVHDRLDYHRPVAYATVSSAMASLHRQGLLTRRRGPARRWEYQAARSRDEHLGELIADLLDACLSPQAALAHALRRPVPATSATAAVR